MEIQDVQVEVMRQHGISLPMDDPSFAVVTINKVMLADERRKMEAAADRVEAAADRIEAVKTPIADADMVRLCKTAAAGASREAMALARAGNWRTIAIAAVALVAAVAISGGVGYWQGHQSGVVDASRVGLQANAALAAMPHADALAWEELIRDNPPISASFAECKKNATPQKGRFACSLPVWIDEPQAAAR